jgi:hypothetical protein
VLLTAYLEENVASGQEFFDELTNDKVIDITAVYINGVQVSFETLANGSVAVTGVRQNDTITFETAEQHNRVLIENGQPTSGSGSNVKFSIGSFFLSSTVTDSVEAGSHLRFYDDGPSVSGNIMAAPALTVDETDLTIDATAPFAAAFSVNHGTDGAGTVTYALSVSAPNADSGLVDTATGQAVLLNAVGGVVEGRTAIDGDLVFTVSVAANGDVTLDQLRAIVHPIPNNHNEPKTLAAANLVVLSATATDADDDSDSADLNIGQNLVFLDDGPSILASAVDAPTLTVDETYLAVNATASFAAQFQAQFGADGPGATPITYALAVSAPNAISGLVDTATGQAVLLNVVGGVVEGRTAVSNDLVFTVSVSATGTVTLDQLRAIVHPSPNNHDESKTLAAANLIVLNGTALDGDGDSATAGLNIGQLLEFKDDGPAIAVQNLVGSGTTAAQVSYWTDDPGADGFQSLSIAAVSYFIGNMAGSGTFSVGPAIAQNGDLLFEGSITDDFNGDGMDDTIEFEMVFKDDGTYTFQLTQGLGSTVTLSTADGKLPAGGPDPVQTMTIETEHIVFTGVQATTDPDDIKQIIGLTEAEIEAGVLSGDYTFVGTQKLNVSTAGIGVDNNNVSGNSLAGIDGETTNGGKIDQSFLVDPGSLLTAMKVYIDNSVGGYNPANEDLYHRVFYSNGDVGPRRRSWRATCHPRREGRSRSTLWGMARRSTRSS